MRKLLVSVFIIAVCTKASFSQDPVAADTSKPVKPWVLGGFLSLNLNQVSFVNWAAGGENTFSATAIGNFSSRYKQNRHLWENKVDASYGALYSKEFKFRTNDDKWEVQTKYGYAVTKNEKLYVAVLANFRSQFANGYAYPDDSTVVSRAIAPGYLLLSVGLDYKPADYFSLFVSPVTPKFIFIRDQDIANVGTFGNDPAVYAPILDSLGNEIGETLLTEGKKIKGELGAYMNAHFQKDIFKNVNLLTKLEFYYDYLADSDKRKYVDVNWETTITMKVNKFLSASLILHLIYDYDVNIPKPTDAAPEATKKGVQFKESLGLGLSYKFNQE